MTTYAISTYHHWRCEFESRSGYVYSMQHYVIKFDSDLWQVSGFIRVLWFPPKIKLTPRYNRNIIESGVKHHKPLNPTYLFVMSFLSGWPCFVPFLLNIFFVSNKINKV